VGCSTGGSTGCSTGGSTGSTAAAVIPGAEPVDAACDAVRSLATVPMRSLLLGTPVATGFDCAPASFCGAETASRSENDVRETARFVTERVVAVAVREGAGRTVRASTPVPTHRLHTAATAAVRIATYTGRHSPTTDPTRLSPTRANYYLCGQPTTRRTRRRLNRRRRS
jgi:hypothetical protein